MKHKRFHKPCGTAGMAQSVRVRVASAGGKAVSQDKAHMAAIGRKGGSSHGAAHIKKMVECAAAARKLKKEQAAAELEAVKTAEPIKA